MSKDDNVYDDKEILKETQKTMDSIRKTDEKALDKIKNYFSKIG